MTVVFWHLAIEESFQVESKSWNHTEGLATRRYN